MAEFPALPLWTDAWVADTHHLSIFARGLYHDLLVLMWRTPGCRVPNDRAWLMAHLRILDSDFDNHLMPLIKELCVRNAGWITQKRLTREHEYVRRMSENNRAAAKVRWEKEKEACNRNAPKPTPIPQLESKKDKRVNATRWRPDAKVSADWIQHGVEARTRNGLAAIDLLLEAERFENYWSSKSGAQATKLDWHKTWINWILKAEGARHGNGKAPTAHDKFFAAGLRVVEKLTGGRQPEDDHAEGDSADEAGRALPPT